MSQSTKHISPEEIQGQLDYCKEVKLHLQSQHPGPLFAFVDTYGCQQNEADSQQIRGFLREMGYEFTDVEENAQIIVINTCAIREHAEQKVLGNVGALVHVKRRNPNQLICLCGCMMQQPEMAEKIKTSFRHVDLVFGPQVLWQFPQFIHTLVTGKGRIFQIPEDADAIAEGLPQVRREGVKAWVSIMYGCNNFCTYCIVPHVRGRERSRQPQDVFAEVERLIQEGYKDITLLGQNVNSYGKDLDTPLDFSDLLRMLEEIPGDFLLRFMTSHPKDATEKLFQTMAECHHVAPSLHLPFQSGNSDVLQAMNRGYTREQYLEEIRQVRHLIPDITLTSDVIVGFPGETRAQFEDTLSLIQEVEFDALFTFIFSPRTGTPAATYPDPVSKEEKSANFQELVQVQNEISAKKHQESVGEELLCLIDGLTGDAFFPLAARTPGNRLVRLNGPEELVGTFQRITVTGSNTWSLTGELSESSFDKISPNFSRN